MLRGLGSLFVQGNLDLSIYFSCGSFQAVEELIVLVLLFDSRFCETIIFVKTTPSAELLPKIQVLAGLKIYV